MKRNAGSSIRLRIVRMALIAAFSIRLRTQQHEHGHWPGGAIGIAFDRTSNTVYFVEYTTGALKRVSAATTCSTTSTPTCNAVTIASGFSHPEDVAPTP
jgi:hypothetical protein